MEILLLSFFNIDKDSLLTLIINDQCQLVKKYENLSNIVKVRSTREYIDHIKTENNLDITYSLTDKTPISYDLSPLVNRKGYTVGQDSDLVGESPENVLSMAHLFHSDQFKRGGQRVGIHRRLSSALSTNNTRIATREFNLHYDDLRASSENTAAAACPRGRWRPGEFTNKIPTKILISQYYRVTATTQTQWTAGSSTGNYIQEYATTPVYMLLYKKGTNKDSGYRLRVKSWRAYSVSTKLVGQTISSTYYMHEFVVDLNDTINRGYEIDPLTDYNQTDIWVLECITDNQSDEMSKLYGSYLSTFSGYDVDIVCLEARGADDATLEVLGNSYLHTDFTEPEDPGTTRVVRMDWPGLSSPINNQTNNDNFTDIHALGVLSCAGGLLGGFAKRSSLRVLYIDQDNGDDIIDCIYAVMTWHLSKPIDPNTNQRKPTILNNSWGFAPGLEMMIALGDIYGATYYTDPNNYESKVNLTRNTTDQTTYGWLPVNIENLYKGGFSIRRISINSTWTWVVGMEQTESNNTFDPIWRDVKNAGIIVVASAGNYAQTRAKPSQAAINSWIEVDSSYKIYRPLRDQGNPNMIGRVYVSSTNPATLTGPEFYLVNNHTSVGCTDHNICVGAVQASDTNFHIESYSDRGPGIDIFAIGDQTLSAAPYLWDPLGDSWRWGLFGGTSAAGPLVAGILACMAEKFRYYRGYWPDYDTLKYYLDRESIKNKIRPVRHFNPDYPAVTTSSKPALPSSTGAANWSIKSDNYWNSSKDMITLTSSTDIIYGGVSDANERFSPNKVARLDSTCIKPLGMWKRMPTVIEGIKLVYPILSTRYTA